MKNKFVLLSLIIIVFFISVRCKTTQHAIPSCYSKYTIAQIIRWGDYYEQSKEFRGFQLNSDGSIFSTIKDSNSNETKNLVGKIDSSRYCSLMQQVRDTILVFQACFEPGDSLKYIEFSNKLNRTSTRVLWNPGFATYGSRGFRAVYDTLVKIQPVK